MAGAAVRYGVETAAALGAELHVVHVTEGGHEAQRQGWLAEWEKGVEVHQLSISGRAAEGIVQCAGLIDADLILMPSRGYGFFRRLWAGSTTLEVLQATERPVWVVKPRQMGARQGFRCTRILCGIEFGDDAGHVLRSAGQWAERFGGRLLIAHAVPEMSEALIYQGFSDMNGTELHPARAFRRMAELGGSLGMPHEIETGTGAVAETLEHLAARWGADLMVVGRGRSRSDGRLGRNVAEILQGARCPVLTVARGAEEPAEEAMVEEAVALRMQRRV